MGVIRGIIHWLVKFAIRFIMLEVFVIIILQVPPDKMTWASVGIFIITVLDSVLADILLAQHWGHS